VFGYEIAIVIEHQWLFNNEEFFFKASLSRFVVLSRLLSIKAIGHSTLGPFLDGPAHTTDLSECVKFVHIDETTAHEAVEHRDTVVIVL